LATISITVEVIEAGVTWEGGKKEIRIPDAIDWSEFIEKAITAASDEIEFLKLRKG
jgi:hypothetical protein